MGRLASASRTLVTRTRQPGATDVDLRPTPEPLSHDDLDAAAVTVARRIHGARSGPVRTDASSPWPWRGRRWPVREDELEALQVRLAGAAEEVLAADPWLPSDRPTLFGGCFVARGRGLAGPGRTGDRVWAAAVAWERRVGSPVRGRRTDRHLRGAAPVAEGRPRQADDVVAQAVVTANVPAPYRRGLLAARDGAVLVDVLAVLEVDPEVVVVDASGLDHPRRAGLAVHLGAATGLPTVGVTRRPLVATGPLPQLRRGARSPLVVDGRCVAYWVCTADGTHPLVAHAGWRGHPGDSGRRGARDIDAGGPHAGSAARGAPSGA